MAKKNTRSKAPKEKTPGADEADAPSPAELQAAQEAEEARAERRRRRTEARSVMRARVADAFIGLARFFWERSWIFSVPLALVLAASFATYSPADPAFSVATARPASNVCGVWGAWTADMLLGAFGASAWWLVLGLVMVAFFAFRSRVRAAHGETNPERINPPKFTAFFGLCALMVGSTSLEALRLFVFGADLPYGPGGVLGGTLAFAVVHYVGSGVALVVFLLLVAIGLSLLMDFSWTDVAETTGRFIDEKILSRLLRSRAAAPEPAPAPEPEPARPSVVPVFTSATLAQERPEEAPAAPEAPVRTAACAPAAPFASPPPSAPAWKPAPAVPAAASSTGLPDVALLDDADPARRRTDEETIQMTSRLIVAKLRNYGIPAEVKGVQPGPVITQYWIEPGPGVKGSQIEGVRDDLRRALGVQAVRIVLSIPGTSCIGIEVPNPVREMVRLKEIIESDAFRASRSALTLAMGKDIAGKPFVMDLAKTPHLLVAGTTGSGKSVGINAMILSMLYRNSPETLRLVLIDPKMLEFSLYNGIPHLLTPVVTDMNKANAALKWLTHEMDRRYAVMSRIGVRQFSAYNEKVSEAARRGEPIRDPGAAKDDPLAGVLEPWPFIVCVVDELADLMLTNRKEVEGEITRLTQKARAAGIHLILATQRPSVDVVTSLIKANVPTRISFQVASTIDSRVILGESGAEQLLGNGDMLLHRPGHPGATRIQGCFVADGEVMRVAEKLKEMGSPSYVEGVTESADDAEAGADDDPGRRAGEADPLYDRAVAIVLEEKRASISYVQRQLGIGYNRAANLLEAMETAGIVSKPTAMGKRTILVPTRD